MLVHHPEIAAKNPHIPWQRPYEMRNALSHGYFNIDLERTWKTVQNDIPPYAAQIKAAMAEITDQNRG